MNPIDLKRTARKTKPPRPAPIDKLPPHSPEAEQGFLGCILIDPTVGLSIALSRFGKVAPDLFFDLRHEEIYATLVDMYEKGKQIDIITLQQELRDGQKLDQVGGLVYLSALPDVVPSVHAIEGYADILVEKYKLRTMLRTCTDVVATIYESEHDPDGILDEAERKILELRQKTSPHPQASVKAAVHKAISTIEGFHQNQGMLTGLATGYSDLDKMTSGLQAGEMIVLAARPSVGKTSLAMNIVEHVAVDHKIPIGIFSLEMTVDALILRMICSRARVNLRNVRDGFLGERDFPKLTGAAGKIANAPIYVDDEPGLSIMELRARARRMAGEFGIKLLVIDYLQLLIALINGRRPERREREISEVSAGVKALAKELRIPVMAISQLSRSVEKEGRKPNLSDLRESGSIEQDSDLVAMLYRPERDGEEQDHQSEAVPINLLIAKQRSGPTGDVHLTFLRCYTRFESAAKVSDEDLPGQASMIYE